MKIQLLTRLHFNSVSDIKLSAFAYNFQLLNVDLKKFVTSMMSSGRKKGKFSQMFVKWGMGIKVTPKKHIFLFFFVFIKDPQCVALEFG